VTGPGPVSHTVRSSCLRRCLAFDLDASPRSWRESSLSPKVPETFSWSQKTLKGHLVVCCYVVEASMRRDKVRCNPLWDKLTFSQVDTPFYCIFVGANAVSGASVILSLTWHRPLNACQRVGLCPFPPQMEPSLATRSIQLFSKQADTAPPAAAPPSTVPSQPVAVPADATAQVSFFSTAGNS
jgi:hypothetical protein